MVQGLDIFYRFFSDYKDQYVLIGGAACDILFESNEANFRATRDLDILEQNPFDSNSLKQYGFKNQDVVDVLRLVYI